jgi:hypothetical protein
LTSEADAESVLPLPSANRPVDFSGALGQFTIAAEASPDHVTAGDPITLRLTVTGEGNFDRESSGLLINSPDNADRADFAPNRLEPGEFTSTLRPLFLQPWFLTANSRVSSRCSNTSCAMRADPSPRR